MISLAPNATYALTVTGDEAPFPGPQLATVGDLDVSVVAHDLTIEGNGATIDASAIDNRAFHAFNLVGDGEGRFELRDMTITGGSASDELTFFGSRSNVGGGVLIDGGRNPPVVARCWP